MTRWARLFFNILTTFAEFEVDLIRMRTREGMAVARAQGKLKDANRNCLFEQRELKRMHDTGEYSITDLGEVVLGVTPDRVPHDQPHHR
jgi:DNA invertase Pin-like site-specific DNA recombinase